MPVDKVQKRVLKMRNLGDRLLDEALTEERNILIIYLRNKGYPFPDIARLFHLTKQAVFTIYYKHLDSRPGRVIIR